MNFEFNGINIELFVMTACAIAFVLVMIIWQLDKTNTLDVKDAITGDNGKFSLSKFGQLISLLVSSWIIINETRHGKLTEWLFGAYMIAWSGANLLNKYLSGKQEVK